MLTAINVMFLYSYARLAARFFCLITRISVILSKYINDV